MSQRKGFPGTTAIGLFLILLGAFWVLSNLDLIHIEFSEWWPLILVAIGFVHLVGGRRFFNPGAWFLIFLGIVFLLTENDILDWHQIWRYWPVILIVLGVSIIIQRKGHLPSASSQEDEIAGSAFFSGVEKKINSRHFRGGSVSALFGGVEIDLRDSQLDENGATIHASTIFGGTDIWLPESWPLDIQSTTIFGGIENKTKNPLQKEGKRLTIKASTIFGGFEIKN